MVYRGIGAQAAKCRYCMLAWCEGSECQYIPQLVWWEDRALQSRMIHGKREDGANQGRDLEVEEGRRRSSKMGVLDSGTLGEIDFKELRRGALTTLIFALPLLWNEPTRGLMFGTDFLGRF